MNEDSLNTLQNNNAERIEKASLRKANEFSWKKYIYGWLYPLVCFILVVITTAAVKSSLDLKDLPLDSDVYNPKSGFSAATAYKHLEAIAKEPHGFDNPLNQKTVEYIINQVKQLQTKTDRLSYIHDNSSQLALPENGKTQIGDSIFSTYFVASNMVAKFKGTNSNGRSIMLSAHYDTRPISPGAMDASLPVSVCLAILEALVDSPPEGYDVMVNFNNGEEGGTLGSRSFKYHPWFNDVDSFINLEASGTGGKPFLFQSSSYSLTKALSSGPYHHANALSNDLFSMGILNSRTDYQNYKNNYGLPGVDIALYRNRAFYHTTKDDLEHTSIASVNYMGMFAYQGVKNIGKYGLSGTMTKAIGFDFFNSTAVYNLGSFYALIAVFWVLEVILLVAYLVKIRHIQPLFTEGKAVYQILKGILFCILSILFTALVGFILVKITNVANTNIAHSWPITIFIMMTIGSFWSQIAVHLLWRRWDRNLDSNSLQMGSYLGVLIIYNIFVLAELVSHVKGFILLLFFVLQAWGTLSSFILYVLFGSHMNLFNRLISSKLSSGPTIEKITNKVQPVISFFVNYFFSAVIIIGLTLPLLYSVNQTAPTGTSPYIPLILALGFNIIINIPLSPNLLAIRHLFHSFIVLTVLLIIVCPILWTRFPYSESAPLPITYNRVVELDPITRQITNSELNFKTHDKMKLLIESYGSTPKNQYKEPKFDVVSYAVEAPKLIDYTKYSPKVNSYTKSGNNVYNIQFEFDFPESKICRIDFPSPVTNLQVKHVNKEFVSMQDPTNPEGENHSIRVMRNDNKLPWTLKFDHKGNSTESSFEITSTCYVFNGEDLQKTIAKLPPWIIAWTRDFGQLGIKTKYTLKQETN